MFLRHYLPAAFFGWVFFLALTVSTPAAGVNLYLKDGSLVRGEITDRSLETVTVSTPKGVVKIDTERLMPISRAQLKLPEEPKETAAVAGKDSETELLIQQVERLLAENESLKKQIALLQQQQEEKIVKNVSSEEVRSPAEGPSVGKPGSPP